MSESLKIQFDDDVDVVQISESLLQLTNHDIEFRDIDRTEATLALPRDMEESEREKLISGLERLGIKVA